MDRQSASRRAAVAVAIVLAALAAWLLAPRIGQLFGRRATTLSDAPSAGHAMVGAMPVIENDGKGASTIAGLHIHRAAPGAKFPPMPPSDTPMRLAYSQIKEQADEGDAVAQCRLAYEVMRCKRLPALTRTARELAPRLSAMRNGSTLASMMQGEIARDRSVCEDYSPAPGDETWRLMLESALNGNRSAALEYATGLWLDPRKPDSDPEALAAYRAYAPRLLQQAVAEGDARAYQLAAMYGRFESNPFGVSIAPADRTQIAAYYLAIVPIAEASYRTFLEKQVESLHLDETAMAEAHARAGSLGLSLRPPPDGEPLVGSNIVGWGKWNGGARCEH
jgi:hypothetical protein